MKIRNKYDSSVIESSSLKDEGYFYRLNNTVGCCNIMFKHDGWEEVKEGLSTRITSLSEEQKTSIVNILRDTLTTWVHEGVIDMIVDVFEPRLSELNLWE